MGKFRKIIILRITDQHLKHIIKATITEKKSRSKIIREAIEKHILEIKNK
jgi:hypothetical protein